MLSRQNRIGRKLFLAVLKKGKNFSSENIYIKIADRGKLNGGEALPSPGFAFVVSAKVAKKATERNKLKRQARAITKNVLKSVGRDVYALVFFKPSIKGKKYGEIKVELENLYKKAKII
ncbi:ribonuclease P protein component [Candidatus Parcubacteria bacterium]|nr:MAG: ribonuclease P protein component [Candidatus Parcubacteria bacterium]